MATRDLMDKILGKIQDELAAARRERTQLREGQRALEARLDRLELRFDAQERLLTAAFERVNDRLDVITRHLEMLVAGFEDHERRITALEQR